MDYMHKYCDHFFVECKTFNFISEISVLLAGCNGVDGDGDVCNPNNISAFSKYVLDHTHNIGVHFMMADGVSRA